MPNQPCANKIIAGVFICYYGNFITGTHLKALQLLKYLILYSSLE